jgi:hypothetical protein
MVVMDVTFVGKSLFERFFFILTKSNHQCGGQFTSKVEGMVSHLSHCVGMIFYIQLFCRIIKENSVAIWVLLGYRFDAGKGDRTSFEEYLSNNPNRDPGIDLTVTVLTTGFWSLLT